MAKPGDNRDQLLDDLRDAAAQDRLLIVTGAGISRDLLRADGSELPGWGRLIGELRARAPKKFSVADEALLDRLMPAGLLDKVHGDALIEASEIIRKGYDRASFVNTIATLCSEATGQASPTHEAIAELRPAGIITFNYDQAHETSLTRLGRDFRKVIYSDGEDIKALLAERGQERPFLLKAHGCVSKPSTLVLTSSSYRAVLSKHRPYRLFLQHALVRYTVLIVGFALRDRDFDQLLATLEVELGVPVSRHVFVEKASSADDEGRLRTAALSAITARFGVEPYLVSDFGEIPPLIRSIRDRPGPLIRRIIEQCGSASRSVRQAAHDRLETLGDIGRIQVRTALADAIRAERKPILRSELIYALGKVGEGRLDVAKRLVEEVERSVGAYAATGNLSESESVAHALVALRRTRTTTKQERDELRSALVRPHIVDGIKAMDERLLTTNGIPRLALYSEAALAEVEARASP